MFVITFLADTIAKHEYAITDFKWHRIVNYELRFREHLFLINTDGAYPNCVEIFW